MTEARIQWLKNNAERVRYYKRKHQRKAYKANPEKFRRRQRKWRRENLDAVRQRDRRYASKNAAARRVAFKKWRIKHRSYFRASNRKQVSNLADWYVRQRLSRNTVIKPNQWPAVLVEAKRAEMKLRKLCRNQKI